MQFGNAPGDDALGIALQGRAQQARQQSHLGAEWGHPSFGPLPDPKWDGLFQALNEHGVDDIKGGPSAQGSQAFRGQQVPMGGAFTPASGQPSGPMMGYGAPDNRTDFTTAEAQGKKKLAAPINGLNQAYQPNFGGQ